MRGDMRRTSLRFALLGLGALALPAAAKEPTRKIILWGGQLAGMVEIMDPTTLALSDVFSGTFLDAARGAASNPAGLPQYDVSFYLTDDRGTLLQRWFAR